MRQFVSQLTYGLMPADGLRFEHAPPVKWKTPEFVLTLKDEKASIEMLTRYATPEEARRSVEPHLRSWEVHAAIQRRREAIRFRYEGCSIARQNIDLEARQAFGGSAASVAITAGAARGIAVHQSYPPPPMGFTVTPIIEAMWLLYERYTEDRERLLPMAYSVFSLLKSTAHDNVEQCAKTYVISRKVLRKLSDLASRLGGPIEARKYDRQSLNRPPTAQEEKWIEATTRMLILRAGERAAGPDAALPMITMNNLPELGSE
jgi:hypothetical protein